MMEIELLGIGLVGPGLAGWGQSIPILQGLTEYAPSPIPPPILEWLPANERRRCTDTIRLAVHVAREAVDHSTLPADSLCSVFASCGDTPIADSICSCLAQDPLGVSPTQFHNSVHNAPAGYWSIATDSRQPSISLSAYDGTFAAGLLEAACLVAEEQIPTLLAAYAVVPPPPLRASFPLKAPFAVALVLGTHQPNSNHGSLKLSLSTRGRPTSVDDPRLEDLRTGNPAARALPLLRALAQGKPASIAIEYLDDTKLIVDYAPC